VGYHNRAKSGIAPTINAKGSDPKKANKAATNCEIQDLRGTRRCILVATNATAAVGMPTNITAMRLAVA